VRYVPQLEVTELEALYDYLCMCAGQVDLSPLGLAEISELQRVIKTLLAAEEL
jgi:hypothetical protein